MGDRLSESVHSITTEDGATLALTELRVDEALVDGPPFLLVHGFAQNRLSYTEGDLPRVLIERGARVFCGELRGHGRSRELAVPKPGYGLEAHLDFDLPALLRQVRELVGSPVHYVGHSMGGLLGYAHAARDDENLASVTALAAPLILGLGRPAARRMATLARPFVKAAPPTLATDRLIRLIRRVATLPTRDGFRGRVRQAIRLANPAMVDAKVVREVLRRSDPESREVFLELIDMARTGRGRLGTIDVLRAVRESTKPIAAAIGTMDPFGDEASVRLIEPGPAPRRVDVLPEVGHVDITLGRSVPGMIERLWPFWMGTESLDT